MWGGVGCQCECGVVWCGVVRCGVLCGVGGVVVMGWGCGCSAGCRLVALMVGVGGFWGVLGGVGGGLGGLR